MNYLAHLVLSGSNIDYQIGNLVADWVRVPKLDSLPHGVATGIRLHRKIDAFTDCHPNVHRCAQLLDAKWGWFAGIILDIYFDYLLAQEFSLFHPGTFNDYIETIHHNLQLYPDRFPEGTQHHIDRLIQFRLLNSYQHMSGIEHALYRTTERLRERIPNRAIDLVAVIPELLRLQPRLAAEFRPFFYELQRQSIRWQAELEAAL